MRTWHAVVMDDAKYEPWDWKFELELRDEKISFIHEVIYVTFTGMIGDDDEVTAKSQEEVEDRVDAMLKGLNKWERRKR